MSDDRLIIRQASFAERGMRWLQLPVETGRSRFSLHFAAILSLIVSLGSVAVVQLEAAGPEPIRLWPDGAPGQMGQGERDIPLVRIVKPVGAATGTAVVVLPGGGYGGLAMDHEGQQIAQWWAQRGVLAAIVTYRHGPTYQHPAPLQDAQRAIRYLRQHASDLQIDPQRVGVMGFSAGGHLASTVSNHFDTGDANSSDPVARQGSRPDFAILCYPVISLLDPQAHKGSRRNLLGENPPDELVRQLSNQLQVTEQTPPTFLFHTAEDPVVSVENALLYYQALVSKGVPSELHVYQKGRHGVGLAANDPVLKSWPERLEDWLRLNNFLSGQQRVSLSGRVTLNGEPLAWGAISLMPRSVQTAPAPATLITRGEYRFAIDEGPVPGTYSVSVLDLGTFARAPSLEDARTLTGDHTQTSLVIEIRDLPQQQMDFDLQVK